MKLTLTPEELVPIVREHLERRLNLTLSNMSFIRQPQMDPERNEQWFIQLEVQPKAEQP